MKYYAMEGRVELVINHSSSDSNQKQKEHQNTMRFCEVKIVVPPSTPIRLKNNFGDVNIKNINQDIECANEFATIWITNTKGV